MEQLNYMTENNMIDNKLCHQYRQAVGNFKIEFEKTCLYRLCEEVVKKLNKILN